MLYLSELVGRSSYDKDPLGQGGWTTATDLIRLYSMYSHGLLLFFLEKLLGGGGKIEIAVCEGGVYCIMHADDIVPCSYTPTQ